MATRARRELTDAERLRNRENLRKGREVQKQRAAERKRALVASGTVRLTDAQRFAARQQVLDDFASLRALAFRFVSSVLDGSAFAMPAAGGVVTPGAALFILDDDKRFDAYRWAAEFVCDRTGLGRTSEQELRLIGASAQVTLKIEGGLGWPSAGERSGAVGGGGGDDSRSGGCGAG